MGIHVHNTHIFRQTCDLNKSVHIWQKVILRHIFVQITFETTKRNTWFYILRQGVPEGRSSEGYASFKYVQPWPWHVAVIPGVGVLVGLVTNKELCQVIWGIIIKNFMHKYSFIVSELLLKFQELSSFVLPIGKDQEGLICLPFEVGSSVF